MRLKRITEQDGNVLSRALLKAEKAHFFQFSNVSKRFYKFFENFYRVEENNGGRLP